jgi:hypothetical protein
MIFTTMLIATALSIQTAGRPLAERHTISTAVALWLQAIHQSAESSVTSAATVFAATRVNLF